MAVVLNQVDYSSTAISTVLNGVFTTELFPGLNYSASSPTLSYDQNLFSYYTKYYQYAYTKGFADKIMKNQEILHSAYLAPGKVSFTNISTKLAVLDTRIAKMEPQVITQSISFLLGAFVALAFVLASKVRY